jgi:hypothetical protein
MMDAQGQAPPPPQGPPPVQPNPTPVMKERGLKPDPFTKKSDYEKFHRSLGLYFRANEAIYPEDLDKIYFTLTLMTEGTPGQWAQNFIEKVDAQAVNGQIPPNAWGTFEEFRQALKKSFADPNKDKNAYNNLEMLKYPPGRSADKFFQEFETLAGRAGYLGANPNHVYLINLIEEKLPRHLINLVYSKDVPITYEAYRDEVVKYDNLNKKLQSTISRRIGRYRQVFTGSSTSTSAPIVKQEEVPVNLGRARPKGGKLWTSPQKTDTSKKTDLSRVTCYGCGKKGHMANQCPNKKRGQQMRSFIQGLDSDEKEFIKDFL